MSQFGGECRNLTVEGVNVIVKGTTNGAQTDFDGNYSLTANVGDVLVFSYIGMTTAEVAVADSSTINVALEEDAQQDAGAHVLPSPARSSTAPMDSVPLGHVSSTSLPRAQHSLTESRTSHPVATTVDPSIHLTRGSRHATLQA